MLRIDRCSSLTKKCPPNSDEQPCWRMILRQSVTWMPRGGAPTDELGRERPFLEHTVSKKQAVCALTNGDNSFQAANIKGTLSKYRRCGHAPRTPKQPQFVRYETAPTKLFRVPVEKLSRNPIRKFKQETGEDSWILGQILCAD